MSRTGCATTFFVNTLLLLIVCTHCTHLGQQIFSCLLTTLDKHSACAMCWTNVTCICIHFFQADKNYVKPVTVTFNPQAPKAEQCHGHYIPLIKSLTVMLEDPSYQAQVRTETRLHEQRSPDLIEDLKQVRFTAFRHFELVAECRLSLISIHIIQGSKVNSNEFFQTAGNNPLGLLMYRFDLTLTLVLDSYVFANVTPSFHTCSDGISLANPLHPGRAKKHKLVTIYVTTSELPTWNRYDIAVMPLVMVFKVCLSTHTCTVVIIFEQWSHFRRLTWRSLDTKRCWNHFCTTLRFWKSKVCNLQAACDAAVAWSVGLRIR